MSNSVIIRLGITEDQPIYWGVWSQSGKKMIDSGIIEHVDDLSMLKKFAGDKNVEVVVDSSAIKMKVLDVEPKLKKQFSKIAPFMFEDELAEDVEHVHFVTHFIENNKAVVYAVSMKMMSKWLSWLKSAHLYVSKIVPDVLLLPLEDDNDFSIMQLDNQLIIKHDIYQGAVVEESLFSLYLSKLFALCNQKNEIEVDTGNVMYSVKAYTPINVMHNKLKIEQANDSTHFFVLFLQRFSKCSVNLLSGEFNTSGNILKVLKKSSKTITVALLLCSLWLANMSLELFVVNKKIAYVQDSSKQIYQQLFSNESKVVNPAYQLESKIRALPAAKGASNKVLVMLGKSQKILSGFKQSYLKGLRFDMLNNELRLQLELSSFDDFEKLKQLFTEKFNVETGTVNKQKNVILTTLILKDLS